MRSTLDRVIIGLFGIVLILPFGLVKYYFEVGVTCNYSDMSKLICDLGVVIGPFGFALSAVVGFIVVIIAVVQPEWAN